MGVWPAFEQKMRENRDLLEVSRDKKHTQATSKRADFGRNNVAKKFASPWPGTISPGAYTWPLRNHFTHYILPRGKYFVSVYFHMGLQTQNRTEFSINTALINFQ